MLLHQQSYAIKKQLVAKIPPTGGISCSSLVLYGIRIVGFHARKAPIIGALMPKRTSEKQAHTLDACVGSLWHKIAGANSSSDQSSTSRWTRLLLKAGEF